MNPFPPIGNVQDGWEVIDQDALPSVECKYELDEDEEDREAALQQCARNARRWLNRLPADEYGVQFGVLYELPRWHVGSGQDERYRSRAWRDRV